MKGWKIFVVAIVLYFVSVFGGFVQDDTRIIENDPQMGRWSPLLASLIRPYYYMNEGNAGVFRPLTSFSLYLNALVTGKEPWGFHLVNVFLYALVCILVFELLKKFFSEKRAFWISLLFTVLPVHVEAVSNIVGRGEILSLGFVLLAVLEQQKKKWELSAGMFLLALLSKETAIVGLPILIFLLILDKEKKDLKIGMSVIYVFVTLSYLILRVAAMGGVVANTATMVENPLKFVGTEQRVMNAFSLVPFGVSKVIFPLHLSYDYSFNQLKLVSNWFDWKVVLGISMMLLSIGSLLTRLRKNTLYILGNAFFWGPILITGNFLFSIGTIFGERLWFWSSLGVVLILSTFNIKLIKGRFGKILLILIIVLLSGRTFIRCINWLSQDRLFIHDVKYTKDSVMAQSNAGAMYLIRLDFEKGKKFLENAEKIYPLYPQLMNNWGMYYLWTGDTKMAKEKFEICLKQTPVYYLCESNLKLIK